MSDDELTVLLHAWCLQWQQILRLQDWNVVIQLVPSKQMTSREAVGECRFVLERKDAVIFVLRPVDAESLSDNFHNGEGTDYELTVVHELLHLHFADLGIPENHGIHEEQVINALSKAFIALTRNQYHPGEILSRREPVAGDTGGKETV